MRGYAICTSQRSGSSYLCQILRSTGVLGSPREYFDAGARRLAGLEPHDTDPEAQFASIQREGATPNGVYGLKLFPTQFDWAAPTRWAARLPNLGFLFLRRRDLLGQALSQARAWQTLQWTSSHEAVKEPAYDPRLIQERLLEIVRHNARWDFYFGRNDVQPLCLCYEDVAADPAAAAAHVATWLGVEQPAVPDLSAVTLQIQRDDTNADWRRRYLAAAAVLSVMHAEAGRHPAAFTRVGTRTLQTSTCPAA
jgi:LPS sulfotransferase NodH